MYRTDDRGFDSWRRQKICLLPKTPISDLGSNHPPIPWIREIFPRRWNRRMRETDQASQSITEVKKEWSCNSSPPICLHGVHNEILLLLPPTSRTSKWPLLSISDWDFRGGNYDRTSWQTFSVVLPTSYMNFK